MIYGTHNSATGGNLLWWLKPLAWIINPTSKCQDRTIQEQLADGVKVFNLQVAYVNGKWRFSHGLALYKEDVLETIAMIKACATKEEPIYFQLYLDRCFWCKQDTAAFTLLAVEIDELLCNSNCAVLTAWIEGTDVRYDGFNRPHIDMEEHYWTMGWADANAKSWIDKLPLPRRHAKRYNAKYKDNCKSKYLMLDFYEL